MTQTSIEWTETTWNPVRGCTRVSAGCGNCYAERIAARFSGPSLAFAGVAKNTPSGPRWTNKVICVEEKLSDPYHWKKPRTVFVNSMSDLFHGDVPIEFLGRVFHVMRDCPQHTFQILTKRSRNLVEIDQYLRWPQNVWIGVSVENHDNTHRIDDLRKTAARTKFLSLEPLLGPLSNLNFEGIDWVIVGGESGPGARAMQVEWVREIREQCVGQDVALFFKQWGGTNKKETGRILDGRTWDEFPTNHTPTS